MTAVAHFDKMVEWWTETYLPALESTAFKRREDHNWAHLKRVAHTILSADCTSCEDSRSRWNGGEFDDGVFCRNACPLAVGCNNVWFATNAAVEALVSGSEQPNCEKHCPNVEACRAWGDWETREQFCIDQLHDRISDIHANWQEMELTIRSRMDAMDD